MLRMNGVCAVMAAVVGRNASLLKLSLNENQVLLFLFYILRMSRVFSCPILAVSDMKL